MVLPRTCSEKKWYSAHERGQSRRTNDDKNLVKADTQFSRATSPLSRGTLKSKGGGKLSIHFCADDGNNWNCFSHNYFCFSAQYLRCSLRFVWRKKACHVRTGRPVLGGQSDPIVCADKFVDENTYTLDRWSCARRSIAKVPRTSWKAITTKSCD